MLVIYFLTGSRAVLVTMFMSHWKKKTFGVLFIGTGVSNVPLKQPYYA